MVKHGVKFLMKEVEAVFDEGSERSDGVPGRVKGSSLGATPALGGQTWYQ